jgi:hypothetical protein
LSVLSDPQTADFKLLHGGSVVWAETTNNGRFILGSDYLLRIEKAGYVPVESPCSNKNRGVICSVTLKKKK